MLAAGFDGLGFEVPLDVAAEGCRGIVPSLPLLLDRLERDGFDVTPDHPRDRGRTLRRILLNDADRLVQRLLLHVVGQLIAEQFVEDDPQRVHVAAGIEIRWVAIHLLRTHVLQRAENLTVAGLHRLDGHVGIGGPGDAEVDDLRIARRADENVVGLEIPVDDPLLVAVMHRVTDLFEECKPIGQRQIIGRRIVGQRLGTGDELHRVVRTFAVLVLERAGLVDLGDARMLASNAKVDVVADFRLADIGAGGEGAPLAPLFHRALAANQDKPVAVLNVGGVANVTWIGDDTILAFDTGPGNALIDDWVACHDAGRLDWGGEIARGGAAKASVVEEMLSSPYFAAPPPKSLDRQDFDLALVEAQSLEDGAATLTAVTVGAVMAARQHFPTPVNKWLVTGGGRNNAYFMERLAAGLGAPVLPVESVGWQGDALEAHAFGYLAVRSLRGLPLSLPTTTGVPAPVTGGRLFRPD